MIKQNPSKKTTLQKLEKMIIQYIKPINCNLECKQCVKSLTNMIYDIFEKKENK